MFQTVASASATGPVRPYSVEAFLVGEALMRHKDVTGTTRTLLTGL